MTADAEGAQGAHVRTAEGKTRATRGSRVHWVAVLYTTTMLAPRSTEWGAFVVQDRGQLTAATKLRIVTHSAPFVEGSDGVRPNES